MAFFSDINYSKPEKGPLLYDLSAILQSVYTILGTKVGSRLFHPDWGGSLSRYLFEPCDELTARSMMYDITQILKEEPRAPLDLSQSFVVPDAENSQFYIQLKLDVPGFSDYERTITLTFKQKP